MEAVAEHRITLFCCMMNGCHKSYGTKFNLKRHVMIAHFKSKKYTCAYCSRTFFSRQNFNEHIFIHTGARPYKCLACGQFFRQISQLSLHKRDHLLSNEPAGCCLSVEELTR